MNTRTNDKNAQQNLASPFAALTMDNGLVAIATTGEATTKTETVTVVTPPMPKVADRRPMPMPRRRAAQPLVIASDLHESNMGVTHGADGNLAFQINDLHAAPEAKLESPVTPALPVTALTPAPAPVALTGWELLEQHLKSRTTIRGHVTRVIKSRQDNRSIVGIKVRVAGLDGFVPFRMLGLSPLDTEHSVTLEMGFRVVELEKGVDGANDRIILNHQLVVTEEKSTALLHTIKIGDTVTGVIRNIKPFGAFIDVNGASVMIHVNDLPQGNVRSVKVGQEVKAQVVKVDKSKNQVGASIRHYFVSQLAVGAEFTGLVKNEETFGVFVQLNETVDGLVHVSQFGDFTPARGNIATVKVLSTNLDKGQVQLALLDLQVQAS